MIRIIASLILVVSMALPLAGCGRRGNPVAPPDATYPRKYPYTPFPNDPNPAATEAPGAEASPAEASPGGAAPVGAGPGATAPDGAQQEDPRKGRPRFDDLRPPGGAAP